MNAIIEKSVKFWSEPTTKLEQCDEFNDIIECIVNSTDKNSLLFNIRKMEFYHFSISFDNNNLYVNQLIRNKIEDQILSVVF